MMFPTVDDILASIVDTIERYVAPEVSGEYAASLCLTVSQLLRSVRARVAREGEALFADNVELRALLEVLRPEVGPETGALIDQALEHGRTEDYPSVGRLQADAVLLRKALVASMQAIPDLDHPSRRRVRRYLQHQLERQRPWLVEAFTGPRR